MKTLEPSPLDREKTSQETGPAAGGRPAKTAPPQLNLTRILVPIDFSEVSRKGLQYAVAFARQFKSTITLVHVIPAPVYTPEIAYMEIDPAEIRRSTAEKLANFAVGAISPQWQGQFVVREGLAWENIVEVAREFQSDMIITTTHGYTGLKHAIIGSTAEKIIRHAPCPVLVVRECEHEFI